jgi:hypothetical protein
MIARFVIDPEAVEEGRPALDDEDVLRQLADVWLDVGVLIMPDGHSCPLIEQIERLPQRLQLEWQRLLKIAEVQGRIHRRGATWPERYCTAHLPDVQRVASSLELLLLRGDNAHDLGLPKDKVSVILSSLKAELCKFEFPSAAETFKRFRQMRQGAMLDENETVLDALERLFGVQSATNGEIVVVDRFALARFIQTKTGSGIENLLKFLARTPRSRSITLYSAMPDGLVDAELGRLRTVVEKYASGVPFKFVLQQTPETFFKNKQHFRYVRFGREVCWIDEGLQAFEGTTAARSSPCSFRKYDDGLQSVEARLRSVARVRTLLRK